MYLPRMGYIDIIEYYAAIYTFGLVQSLGLVKILSFGTIRFLNELANNTLCYIIV